MTKSYEHKELLNRLYQMQQSPYYATACHDLVKAEMAIVSLEDRLNCDRAILAARTLSMNKFMVERDTFAASITRKDELLRQALELLNGVFEYEGDVFGARHNDAVDTISAITQEVAT